jgi:hypothetical protein
VVKKRLLRGIFETEGGLEEHYMLRNVLIIANF